MEFHTLLFLFRWLPVVLLLYLLYFRTHAREACCSMRGANRFMSSC